MTAVLPARIIRQVFVQRQTGLSGHAASAGGGLGRTRFRRLAVVRPAGGGRPLPEAGERPAEFADRAGQWHVAGMPEAVRRERGTYLTPVPLARFMAGMIRPAGKRIRLLDPAAGAGVLACAAVEALCSGADRPERIDLVCHEVDAGLADDVLGSVLGRLASWCMAVHRVDLTARAETTDFVLRNARFLQSGGKRPATPAGDPPFDAVIANPPYLKLKKIDPRAVAASKVVHGQPNIYALFMAVSAALLRQGGDLVYLVPRSFSSGRYFRRFREEFFKMVRPAAVHVFHSRNDAFSRDGVLQENIVIRGKRDGGWVGSGNGASLAVTSSRGVGDIGSPLRHEVPLGTALDMATPEKTLRIPQTPEESRVLEEVDRWPNTLGRLGLEASTGPVIPFRAAGLVSSGGDVPSSHVPLLRLANVSPFEVRWPAGRASGQHIAREGAGRLLLPNRNYVLLRRFSTKDEGQRLVAAPYIAAEFDLPCIGLENHLNYLHRPGGEISEDEAWGLAALFNGSLMNTHFRVSNGNTQVSATELRAMRLPERGRLLDMGRRARDADGNRCGFGGGAPGAAEPGEVAVAPDADGAKAILKALGMPAAQQNRMSALTLLALCGLAPGRKWSGATRRPLTVSKGIMARICSRFGVRYAPNTRETIRRMVLHQFLQGGVADRNPFEPDLPTNSPRVHYAVTEDALRAVRAFDSGGWKAAVRGFHASRGRLGDRYAGGRRLPTVPVELPEGAERLLSPGAHNEIQRAVVEEFAPRFAPGAGLLYLGDTAKRDFHIEAGRLADIGVIMPKHGKFPDVILHDMERDRLFLVEAVSTHGPVSPKRKIELEDLLSGCEPEPVFVSAMSSMADFRKHLEHISWGTVVWLSDSPDHMVHFNGGDFTAEA